MKKENPLDFEKNCSFKLYTRREVAEIFHIGISTLDQIPEEKLPRVHINKSVRFTPNSLEKFILENERGINKLT